MADEDDRGSVPEPPPAAERRPGPVPGPALGELLSRPQSDRVVLRAGEPLATSLPDYRALDPLLG